jgi:hypothetical protein
MSGEDKVLKIELGFDADATSVINEMKKRSQTESTEHVILNALRCYDWYLREGRAHPLYQKRGHEWHKIDLQF